MWHRGEHNSTYSPKEALSQGVVPHSQGYTHSLLLREKWVFYIQSINFSINFSWKVFFVMFILLSAESTFDKQKISVGFSYQLQSYKDTPNTKTLIALPACPIPFKLH